MHSWCRKGHVRDEWVSVHYVKAKSDEPSFSSQNKELDSEDLDFDNVDFSKFIVTEDIEETESPLDKSEEEILEDSPNELVEEIIISE